ASPGNINERPTTATVSDRMICFMTNSLSRFSPTGVPAHCNDSNESGGVIQNALYKTALATFLSGK
ncbi:MAG TPA: hypothetical protein VIS78_12780, partial [Blastocatellia bacterium]